MARASAAREKQMNALGITDRGQLERQLQEAITFNPSSFAGMSGPKKLLMFVATNDDRVPTENQWGLVRAWGNPEVISWHGTHMQTILHTFLWHEERIVSFLLGTKWRKFR